MAGAVATKRSSTPRMSACWRATSSVRFELREQRVGARVAEAVPVGRQELAERARRARRRDPAIGVVRRRRVERERERRAGDGQLEVAGLQPLEPGAPFVGAQGDVDSDRAEIARDHLRGAHPIGPAADDLDRQGQATAALFAHTAGAAAPARLVEERGGGACVVAHPAVGGDRRIAPARVGVRQPGAVARARVAVQADGDDPLTIDGQAERLAHAHVVERRARRVRI